MTNLKGEGTPDPSDQTTAGEPLCSALSLPETLVGLELEQLDAEGNARFGRIFDAEVAGSKDVQTAILGALKAARDNIGSDVGPAFIELARGLVHLTVTDPM